MYSWSEEGLGVCEVSQYDFYFFFNSDYDQNDTALLN